MKDKKLFHEDFYKKAVKDYEGALQHANTNIHQGTLKKSAIAAQFEEERQSIQDGLDQGFNDLIQDLNERLTAKVSDYENEITQQQQNDGAGELIRRQNLNAKISNADPQELSDLINEQAQKEVVSDYDYSILKKAVDEQGNEEHAFAGLTNLRKKLPANVAKSKSEYKDLEQQLFDAKFTLPTNLYIQDQSGEYIGHNMQSEFNFLLNDYE